MSPQQDEVIPEEELEREAMDARLDADDGTGIELCPSCLQGVSYADSLCPHCGAPVSGTSGMAPWERTLAEGFIYRSAVAKPTKPIVLIGVWVIFFPSLVFNGLLMMHEAKGGTMETGYLLFSLFGAIISVAALYQTTLNYFKRSQVTAG